MMLERGIGQAVSFPAGYSLAGSCSTSGSPLDPSYQYAVQTPAGVDQCMTWAQIVAQWPGSPAPATQPANYIPNQTAVTPTTAASAAAQAAITAAANTASSTPLQTAVQTNSNPLATTGIVATDGSSFMSTLETDYGPLPLWGWLAAATAGLFLLNRK